MRFNGFQLRGLLAESKGFVSAYTGMYPDFVFGKDLDVGTTPVFFYHRIGGELFRHHLQHLKRNGYKTLTGDELYDTLTHPGLADRRQVVLTFDDGLDDLYSVVYPLLQKFRLTAVAYIVPGWVGKPGFVTWSQIEEMHDSGYVDFQSHSMRHSFIFTSPKVVDFLHPRFFAFVPAGTQLASQQNANLMVKMPPLGSPVYTWSSRLSDSRQYVVDQRIESLCATYVSENGQEEFFKKYGWRRKLWRLITTHHPQKSHTYESNAEQQEAIMSEIDESKRVIERHLRNKVIKHFAFPWHESGQLAKKMLLDRGYRTIGMGLLRNGKHRMIGPNSFEVSRINGDFLPALPGEGRQSFWNIMSHKVIKRNSGTNDKCVI